MKSSRLIPILILIICAGQVNAIAQESGVDIKAVEPEKAAPQITGHIGLSGAPLIAATYFSQSRRSFSDYGTMSSIYEDYSGAVSTAGTILGGVDVKLNRMLSVTVNIGVNVLWRDNYSGVTNSKSSSSTGVAVYLFPMAKFCYLNRQIVKLYGSAGFGAGKYFGYPTTSSSSNVFKNPLKLEAQLVPIGVELGKKLFGFAEFGVGTVYLGIQAGVGYNF